MQTFVKWDFTRFEPITESYLESISCTGDQADRISILLYDELNQVNRHVRKYSKKFTEEKEYSLRVRAYIAQLESDYDIACAYAYKQFKKGY